jgi:putative endonuclease
LKLNFKKNAINFGEQMNTKILGVQGETLAKDYLIGKKYTILAQNYVTKIGEIDIIAKINDITVFVEVKDRQTKRFGYPREAVTPYKQEKIRRVATQYMLKHNLMNSKVRFDCIEILGDTITHLEGCF